MLKKAFLTIVAVGLLFGLTGCIKITKKSEVVGSGSGIFWSQDRGETFASRSKLLTPGAIDGSIGGTNVTAMLEDPNDPYTLYVGTAVDGLYYSYTAGDGWTRASDLYNKIKGVIYSVAVDPKNKCNVYVAIGNQIAKSSDCNRTWKIGVLITPGTEVIKSLAIDWANPANLFAVTVTGAVYRSGNYGDNWTRLADIKKEISRLVIDPTDSKVMYAVSPKAGLYRSSDAGNKWDSLQAKMKNFKGGLERGVGLGVAKDTPNTIFYLSRFGLLKSSDRGDTWSQVKLLTGDNTTDFTAFDIAESTSKILFYTDAKVLYRSFDGGASWDTVTLPSVNRVAELLINSKSDKIIYFGFQKVTN